MLSRTLLSGRRSLRWPLTAIITTSNNPLRLNAHWVCFRSLFPASYAHTGFSSTDTRWMAAVTVVRSGGLLRPTPSRPPLLYVSAGCLNTPHLRGEVLSFTLCFPLRVPTKGLSGRLPYGVMRWKLQSTLTSRANRLPKNSVITWINNMHESNTADENKFKNYDPEIDVSVDEYGLCIHFTRLNGDREHFSMGHDQACWLAIRLAQKEVEEPEGRMERISYSVCDRAGFPGSTYEMDMGYYPR